MAAKGPPGHFSILYFASAASFTGRAAEHLTAPVRAGELFERLEASYPGIGKTVLDSCAVTVNLAYIDMDGDAALVIQAGDEVAIIPPVSSG